MKLKEYENVLNEINLILLKEGIKIHGEAILSAELNEAIPQFRTIIDGIADCWDKSSEDTKNEISKLIAGSFEKRYIGSDLKWTLYQYICDIGILEDNYELGFVCGKFAYSKISNLVGFKEDVKIGFNFDGLLDLNGEEINIYKDNKIDKKKLVIFKRNAITRMDQTEPSPIEILYELYFA